MKGEVDSEFRKLIFIVGGIVLLPFAIGGFWVIPRILLHEPVAKLNTRYAPKFSFERFAQLQNGDSRERVIELIGKPLSWDILAYKPGDEARGAYQTVKTREEVTPGLEVGSEWLHYSQPKSDGDFRWIIVYLDKDCRVTGTNDFVTD